MIIREISLTNLLQTNQWFGEGSKKQFIKLLEANEQGASIKTLAAIIWACSDGVSREEIYSKLKELEQKELDEYVLYLFQSYDYADEEMLIDDPYICYEMV